jgi:hypothetical protein
MILRSILSVFCADRSWLRERARQATDLRERLQRVADALTKGREPKGSAWLELLELEALYQQHLTADETRALRHPRAGNAAELEAQWSQLIQQVSDAMRNKLSDSSQPTSTRRWNFGCVKRFHANRI